MSLLNIVIYDQAQKVEFDYALAALLFLLMILGILLLKASKIPAGARLRPGLYSSILQLFLKASPRKNRVYGRAAIGSCVLISFVYIANYIGVVKPEFFNDLAQTSGRLVNVEGKNIKGVKSLEFQLDGQGFSFPMDKGYIGQNKLTVGDSIVVFYLEEKVSKVLPNQSKGVIRLEVVK